MLNESTLHSRTYPTGDTRLNPPSVLSGTKQPGHEGTRGAYVWPVLSSPCGIYIYSEMTEVRSIVRVVCRWGNGRGVESLVHPKAEELRDGAEEAGVRVLRLRLLALRLRLGCGRGHNSQGRFSLRPPKLLRLHLLQFSNHLLLRSFLLFASQRSAHSPLFADLLQRRFQWCRK